MDLKQIARDQNRYNGWTNYETWNVKLWLDNDEGSYRLWQTEAQECWDDVESDKTFTRLERAAYELAERLKNDIAVENQPDLGSTCYTDLLSAALSEVNWGEIADNLLEEVEKEEEAAEAE